MNELNLSETSIIRGSLYVTPEDIKLICSNFSNTIAFSAAAGTVLGGTIGGIVAHHLEYGVVAIISISAGCATGGMWLGLQTIFLLLKSDSLI